MAPWIGFQPEEAVAIEGKRSLVEHDPYLVTMATSPVPAPNSSTPPFEPIAIVGMAMRLPGRVRNGKEFWDMLVQKRDGLCEVPEDRYSIDGFFAESTTSGTVRQRKGYFLDHVEIKQLDTSFFAMPRKELEKLDPQQRQLLEVTWECMENAGATNWRDTNIGCFVGVLGEDWRDLNSKEAQQGGTYRVTGFEDSFLANRISFEYNLHGPSLTIKTACSSSLSALHLACNSIRLGDCSSALVAGSSLMFSPGMTLAFSEQGILSPTGTCKTFDAGADGYARGEAINMIYVKKLSDAVAAGDPVRAVIRASAANSDGRTPGIMNPSPEAQEALIRRAYAVAGITDVSQTGYVECHGTGTQAGDPLETAAVAKVFGEKGILITSVKPNVGHAEGAAGISSVIKAVLSLENRTIPPNIFFQSPNPRIPFQEGSLRVPVEPEAWPADRLARVSVNSFGIGGANAHIILDAFDKTAPPAVESEGKIEENCQTQHLLLFSANSKGALDAGIDTYTAYAKGAPSTLQDLSYTLAARREHLSFRAFSIAKDSSQLEATSAQPADELRKPAAESRMHTAELSQPLCTAVQIALVDALRAWKIQPDAVLGHSSGEIAAAYACGAIKKEAAMAIATFRGVSAGVAMRAGGMAAIGLGREAVSAFLEPGVVVACDNSQNSTTLSGDLEQVEKVVDKIKVACPDVLARMLKVDKAYHSHHMQAVGAAYQEQLTGVVKSSTQTAPFYSSVTASKISDADALGPAYWRQNLEQPVLFNPALRALRSDIEDRIAFVEIGPHPALKAPLKQILREVGQTDDVHVSSLVRGADCQSSLLSLVGNLFQSNYIPDLASVTGTGSVLTDLPGYSWVRDTNHWDEPRLSKDWRFRTQPPHELLGVRMVEVGTEPVWRNILSVDNLPWLEGHQVAGRIIFPAAGYIGMVGEAIRQVTGSEGYSLRNVKISSALALEHSADVETVTVLSPLLANSPDDSPWYSFQIVSHNGRGWTRHCSGEARPSYDEATYPSMIEPATPLPRKVTSRSWYEAMKSVGFCYDGLFHGLHEVSAATTRNEAVGGMTSPGVSHCTPYRLHPAVIDQSFQLLCIAALRGQIRKCKHLSVPTFIEQITVLATSTDLMVRASGSISERGAFNGDLLVQGDGKVCMYMKGLDCSPLSSSESLDADVRLVQQIEWQADSDFMSLESCFREKRDLKRECLLLESLFLLCSADTADRIKLTDSTPEHLQKHLAWMKNQVNALLSGERNLVDPGHLLCSAAQRLASIESITAEIQKTQLADCGVAIMRLFADTAAIFAGDANPLDILMNENLLGRLYDILDSGDYKDCVATLGYRNPRQKILEVGAGTGGTTAIVLEALKTAWGERMYSKYSYTDISPGFMAAAKTRFKDYDNIEYQVLDITIDPGLQNFEQGTYDLIICSNVVHATPSLNTSLKHLRSLLRPGGRLFLRELCPQTKWVNYIWGHLSGWWLGADDQRPDEPYVSPARWSQELAAAGFDAPDTVAFDAPPPWQLGATILASAPLESETTQRITVMCASPGESHVETMKARLEADGTAVDICLFGQTPPPKQDVICLMDISTPVLYDMSQETFDFLVSQLFVVKGNIFWVTGSAQTGCEDPRYAMVLGLARTARSEEAARIYTIELDGKTPFSVAVDKIAEIQSRVAKTAKIEGSQTDWEYAIIDSTIHISRLHWQTMSNALAQSVSEKSSPSRRLDVPTPGLLHTMRWRQEPLPDPQGEDVCVEIKAVGLNFKDVLIAMGVLDNDVAEIGLEASGIVRAKGLNVTRFDIGDRVAFMSPGSFTTSRVVPSSLCVKLDPSITFEEGAAIPCVYATALMSLVDKGNLQKGESVLIHSACGGVGLAAIQIAQSIGAEVFCTVGSPEKVKYLVETYSIPDSHIFHSRDATFAAGVMRATDGKGVDLVLNSLAGELLHASWKCVAEFGTMVEIGKRDFRRRARLAMESFEANRTFVGLDLGLVYQHKPLQAISLLQRCMSYIEDGVTKPLPLAKVFDASAVQDAFRFMQGGQHIGKIVVSMPSDPEQLSSDPTVPKISLREDRSYLLVGGLGGLGKVVASWMVEQGARHLVFLSRSGDAHRETRDFLDELRSQGCQAQVFKGSVSNKTDVQEAISGAAVPIAGVINMSMVLKDASLFSMTFEDWTIATGPKVQGTQNLHEAVSSDLDFFILFGSCSGIGGHWGQANYAAANTYVDAFVQYRHSLGLPASVIDLGAVGDAGYVSKKPEVLASMHKNGMHLLREQDVLDSVALAMHTSKPHSKGTSHVVVGILATRSLTSARSRVPWKHDPRMSFFQSWKSSLDASPDAGAENDGLRAVLELAASAPESLTESSTQEMIATALGSTLSSFLLKSDDEMRLDQSLENLGVDSLVAMELRNYIRQKLGIEIGVFQIIHGTSLLALAEEVATALVARYS